MEGEEGQYLAQQGFSHHMSGCLMCLQDLRGFNSWGPGRLGHT